MKKFLLGSLFGIFLFGSLQALEPSQPGLFFSLDYLYWKFEQEQSYFVAIEADGKLEFKEQKFAFSSGFRAGIGYNFAYENSDIALEWTCFRVNDTVAYTAPAGETVFALDIIGLTASDIAQAQSAESRWHLSYDIIDLKLGGSFYIGNRLTLHPTVGVRGGRIDQIQYVTYGNLEVNMGEFETCTAKLKNEFYGGGLMAGVDWRFYLGRQIGLFSSLNGALLYGHYDIKTAISAPLQVQTSYTNFDNSRKGIAPVAQGLLGVDWRGCLCHRWPISLGVGYEMQFWWNMARTNNNRINANYVNYRSSGDLFSQGLTLHTSMQF